MATDKRADEQTGKGFVLQTVDDLDAELLLLLAAQVEYHATLFGLTRPMDWPRRQTALVENPFWSGERYGYIENQFVRSDRRLGVTVWTQTGFAPENIRTVKNLRGGSLD